MTRRLASPLRWLHIYLSMLGLAVTLFFSVTGLTLNHPGWFSEAAKEVTARGQVDIKWMQVASPTTKPDGDADHSNTVAKLEVVEHLRKTHGVHGELAEFRIDEQECSVTFKGPGYSADAYIKREDGSYTITQNLFGFVAILNDLHKGRDTGKNWSLVIDISAILLIVISLTGVALLLYIKRKRIPGIIVAIVGGAAATAVMLWLIK